MIIRELHIRDFRNYKDLHLTLSPEINVFIGENAQGKTNVLEAICLLSLAKSHRTHRDMEMIGWEAESAFLEEKIERDGRHFTLDMQLFPRGKKVRVNGIEKRKISDFVGHLNVVLFAPEDLLLVKGAPQARRRFLDIEIGQVSPQYLYNLTQYTKVLTQRNTLLKEAQKMDRSQTDMIQIWDEQLVVYGTKVVQKRLEFLDKLMVYAADIHQRITNGQEQLRLQYASSLLEPQERLEQFEDRYRAQLQQRLRQDIARGSTSIGPHRDDIDVWIDGREVHTYGSQGQQRTAALSMKLAEIELIRSEVGEYPVLLLDDVLSELDGSRQLHLIQSMGERVQTLITTTSTFGLEAFIKDQTCLYRVQNGTIEME